MPEITRRRTGELLRKLFQILIARPDGMQAQDALNALKAEIQLSEYEKGVYKDGGPRFVKIVRFATIDAVKAGWLIKHKGRWSITEEGKAAFLSLTDPEAFYRRAVQLYGEWKRKQPESNIAQQTDEEAENDVNEKTASITFEQAEEQAWLEIERYLTTMNPYDFQEVVAALLRAMGYHVSWVSPPGKDHGIDILAAADPLGARGPRVKVQVRRRGEAVSADGLNAFMALLGDDDVGIFVSAGGFTKPAEEAARMQEKRKVTLIDLERFFDCPPWRRRTSFRLAPFLARATTRQANMTKFFYVYIPQSEADPQRFYTGLTDDLRLRLRAHNSGRVPHTAKWKPWRLKTYVALPDWTRAAQLERYLKSASGRAFAKRRF